MIASLSVPEAPEPTFVVRQGRILAYRMLDIADAIDLAAAERVTASHGCRRPGLSRDGAQSLVLTPGGGPLGNERGLREFARRYVAPLI